MLLYLQTTPSLHLFHPSSSSSSSSPLLRLGDGERFFDVDVPFVAGGGGASEVLGSVDGIEGEARAGVEDVVVGAEEPGSEASHESVTLPTSGRSAPFASACAIEETELS